MNESEPITLTPTQIQLNSPEFQAISRWPYADSFVARLLQSDIPQRVRFGNCRVWIYRDPEGSLVGFGTLDVCHDYKSFTNNQAHPYIPLLAINPTIKSKGYGTSIVQHLIDEAALLACTPETCHDVLFLDVYTSSEKAINVYSKCGFVSLNDDPIPDDHADDKLYIVMAKRVGIA